MKPPEQPGADLEPLDLPPEVIERADAAYKKAVAERLLGDRMWRLRNLYHIAPEGGGVPVPFVPRAPQEMIYKHLLETPELPAYIIKSRRMGFSTALSVFSADQTAFCAGQNINLVDLTQPDAFKKMRQQVRYAVDSLPRQILERLEFVARNESHLAMRVIGQPDSAISNLFAGMNARGGDASGLWVSEWGPLAAQDPHRSGKILNGAFPAARKGWRVVETTWMGGKNGDLWELVKPLYEGNPNGDGKIYFFPWHDDPECVHIAGEITQDVIEYFHDLENQVGKKFSEPQKKFWAIEKTRLRHKMAQEFPSTLEEALSAPGNAPKFSERGTNWIERQQATHRTQYGLLHVRNDRAIWEEVPEGESSAWLRIWEHPVPGRRYVLHGDYCTGEQVEKPDFHALGVLCDAFKDEFGVFHPKREVAAIKTDQRTDLDILAKQTRALQLYYGDCMIAPEINNLHGYVSVMRAAGCINIYSRQLYPDAKDDKRLRRETGWKTTPATKPLICEELATAIREEEIIVHCPRMLSELRAFQIDLKALEGHHDDWVMSLAIGNYVLPQCAPMVAQAPTVARAPSDHQPVDQADHFYPSGGPQNFSDSVLA